MRGRFHGGTPFSSKPRFSSLKWFTCVSTRCVEVSVHLSNVAQKHLLARKQLRRVLDAWSPWNNVSVKTLSLVSGALRAAP